MLVDQQHCRDRGDRLGHGEDAEYGVIRHRRFGRGVAHPEELVIDRLAVLLDQQDSAGNLFGRDFVAEEFADFLELLLIEMGPRRNVEGALGSRRRYRGDCEQRAADERPQPVI